MLEPGALVGRYEIMEELGRGGMARVYLARHVELGKSVALKELTLGPADPHLAERFLREARMSGALAHPNIVTVFDYFEHQGLPYIAM
jgi:serine/threonine protein kinase